MLIIKTQGLQYEKVPKNLTEMNCVSTFEGFDDLWTNIDTGPFNLTKVSEAFCGIHSRWPLFLKTNDPIDDFQSSLECDLDHFPQQNF